MYIDCETDSPEWELREEFEMILWFDMNGVDRNIEDEDWVNCMEMLLDAYLKFIQMGEPREVMRPDGYKTRVMPLEALEELEEYYMVLENVPDTFEDWLDLEYMTRKMENSL